jgi:competence CoiA-like predicted nuclease
MATALGALGETTVEINDLKRKVDMQMMYCSVCKIFLNSSLQADAHFAGKSHKNKVKSVCSEVGANPS